MIALALALALALAFLALHAEAAKRSDPPQISQRDCRHKDQTEFDYFQYVQFRKRIHQKRIYSGLHPLIRSPNLDALAREHSGTQPSVWQPLII